MFRKVSKKLLLGFKDFFLACFALYFGPQFMAFADTDIAEFWAEPFNLRHIYMPYSWEFTAILVSLVSIAVLIHYKLFCNRINRKVICYYYKSKIVLPSVILLVLFNPFYSLQHLLAIIIEKSSYFFIFDLSEILSVIFTVVMLFVTFIPVIALCSLEELSNEIERKESKKIENYVSEEDNIFQDFNKEV